MAGEDLNVQTVKGIRGDQAPDTAALQPGALTRYDDGEWTFTGNDKITPAEVMGRITELESANEPDLKPFVGAKHAQVFAAQQNLMQHNRHLKGQDPDQPVPANEQFVAQGGQSLKRLLAPFKNNLDKLRDLVAEGAAARVGLGEASNKMTGNVRGSMLGLPTDPKI